jgi:Tol biopolymer transport system component
MAQLKRNVRRVVFAAFITFLQSCGSEPATPDSSPIVPDSACSTLACQTAKYSLLVADLDGTNVSVVRTSSYQEMTHPRVSGDKKWIAYTAYNDRDAKNCANLEVGYRNTEIRAIQVSGTGDKSIIAPVPGELHSNNYWVGTNNEFTYLAGPETALTLFRATVDANMTLVGSPTQIAVPAGIVPLDPAANASVNKIVYPGLYQNNGSFYKSIFMMNLSDGGGLVGLTLGRDHAGTPIVCTAGCTNVMENDPKISPDGTKVAFMRQAPVSGAQGFGFHIFVVPIASPQTEADISYATWADNILNNDVLPEWLDNNTIVFSTLLIESATKRTREVFTMKADGAQRTKVALPPGFLYSDVFPFVDGTGKQRLVIAAEKIDATCTP